MGSIDDFSRYSFPDDFVFGTSSSAYQYEGETNKHGRGPAIWDTFTEEPKNSVKWFKQFLRRDYQSPVPRALPLGASDEKSKIEDGLARDAKRPRNAGVPSKVYVHRTLGMMNST